MTAHSDVKYFRPGSSELSEHQYLLPVKNRRCGSFYAINWYGTGRGTVD